MQDEEHDALRAPERTPPAGAGVYAAAPASSSSDSQPTTTCLARLSVPQPSSSLGSCFPFLSSSLSGACVPRSLLSALLVSRGVLSSPARLPAPLARTRLPPSSSQSTTLFPPRRPLSLAQEQYSIYAPVDDFVRSSRHPLLVSLPSVPVIRHTRDTSVRPSGASRPVRKATRERCGRETDASSFLDERSRPVRPPRRDRAPLGRPSAWAAASTGHGRRT